MDFFTCTLSPAHARVRRYCKRAWQETEVQGGVLMRGRLLPKLVSAAGVGAEAVVQDVDAGRGTGGNHLQGPVPVPSLWPFI